MQYDLYNKHGVEICHAVKCRKQKKLNDVYNGKFCKYHTDVLKSIRESLYYAKEQKNPQLEIYYRQQEIEFRKIPSDGHMFYQARLEDTILEDYLSLT